MNYSKTSRQCGGKTMAVLSLFYFLKSSNIWLWSANHNLFKVIRGNYIIWSL